MDKNIISSTFEDYHSSILKKILSQNTLERKAGVYHLFEYTITLDRDIQYLFSAGFPK